MSSKYLNTLPKDNSTLKNHDILSEYTLKGIIGKGTFSIVQLGINKLTKEKVAIKIMQKNKIINKEDLIRIQREIEMLSRLSHPNVIKIYKIKEDLKKFYIIMEYCENGELFNRIVEKQRLSEDEAAYFYYQIICGLEYIHKNSIAHRDLKPENLLLSKDDILKIIDFGLSNYSSFNFLLGTPCGSPCYASPEMVCGKKYNGFLIDIWSTGIILFAMICGYLPFEDNDNEVLFGKILKCKIHYPKHIGKIPLDLMTKIIVPEPSKRITLSQIKEHPFYLRGKLLFSQRHPEINNNKIKEIMIKRNLPITKNNSIKNKDKKDIKKLKIITAPYYPINSAHINNINNTYLPAVTENYNYNLIINDYNGNNYNRKEKNGQKMESPSCNNLNSDEIPMDSIPKEYNDNKSVNTDNCSTANKNIKKLNNDIAKKPENNLKKSMDMKLNKDKNNKSKEKFIIEYYPKDNSYNTIGRSTTATSNNDFIYNNENVNFMNYTKYDKNNKILMQNNYLSNSAPRNNDKNSYYDKKKYPHNNHNKISRTIIKKNRNISKYNDISYISKKIDNNKHNIENNMNLSNINQNYNQINNKFNTYTISINNNNNTINATNDIRKNKQKIPDVFNELRLIQKNKNKNYNVHSFNRKNILQKNSLSIGKTLPMPEIYYKDINMTQTSKEGYNLNRYIQNINHTVKTKKNKNIYNDKYIKTFSSNTTKITKDKNYYTKENSPPSAPYDVSRNLNDKCFESITINNNNSINLHEPKLYIYVENNTNNNNLNNDSDKNKANIIFKIDKKNNTTKYIDKNINIKNINNIVNQTKKINKKISEKDAQILNRLYAKNNYNLYNINYNNKINKTTGLFGDYNKNLLEIIKKNNSVTTNKKSYDELYSNSQANYLTNFNEKIFDIYKDNNIINYKINKSINLIDYYKNNKTILDNNDYLYKSPNQNVNSHNINQTEINQDVWTYDRKKEDVKILNNLNDNYFISDKTKNLRSKNFDIINNNMSNINNNNVGPFDNIDYKIKLQKMQKKSGVIQNNINEKKKIITISNDNNRYIMPKSPKTNNINNIEPIVNYSKLNTIVTDGHDSSMIKANISNLRNYKKFIRQYNAKK